MRGTLISILVGALVGALLTLGSSVHASRAPASRATQPIGGRIAPVQVQVAVDPVSRAAIPAAPPSEQATLAK